MEFYRILEKIMNEKGLTVADTARICGLKDSTVRSILTRKQQNVALEVAFKLSDGLDVSLELLDGRPELSPKKPAFEFTEFEKQLVIAFRESEHQDAILDLLHIVPEKRELRNA